MSFWSLNTCSKYSCNKNEEFMINNNLGCVSLAHNINDYNNRLIKNGTNTLKQFNYFLQNAKKGDTIYLDSLENAIWKSSPLPIAPDIEVFQENLVLQFEEPN